MRLELIALTLIASIAACGGEDPADTTPTPTPSPSPSPTPSPSPSPTVAPGPVCDRGVLEADFQLFVPFGGPGVDPATGKLRPSAGAPYLISSTYIRLRPEPAAQQAFGELMGPIAGALQQQPGLAAVLLGTSMSCGTARTLTVWASEEEMYAFVGGAPHAAAMARVAEVSRGGSLATHWVATGTAAAEWPSVLPQLRAYDGPLY